MVQSFNVDQQWRKKTEHADRLEVVKKLQINSVQLSNSQQKQKIKKKDMLFNCSKISAMAYQVPG